MVYTIGVGLFVVAGGCVDAEKQCVDGKLYQRYDSKEPWTLVSDKQCLPAEKRAE